MKLTKSQLKRIIQEELQKIMQEQLPGRNGRWRARGGARGPEGKTLSKLDPTALGRELIRKVRSGKAAANLKTLVKGPPEPGLGDDCGHISDEAQRHACYQRQKEERHTDALAQAAAAADGKAGYDPAADQEKEESARGHCATLATAQGLEAKVYYDPSNVDDPDAAPMFGWICQLSKPKKRKPSSRRGAKRRADAFERITGPLDEQKSRLKQIIKEELKKVLQEEDWEDRPDMYSLERGYQGALVPPIEHRSTCEKLTINFLRRMGQGRVPDIGMYTRHGGLDHNLLALIKDASSWMGEKGRAKLAAAATRLCAQNPRFHCKDPRVGDKHPECKDEQKWSAKGTTKYLPSEYVDKYGRQRQGAGVAQPLPEGE